MVVQHKFQDMSRSIVDAYEGWSDHGICAMRTAGTPSYIQSLDTDFHAWVFELCFVQTESERGTRKG